MFVGKKYSSVKNFVTKQFFRHLFTDEISTDKVAKTIDFL